MEIKTFSEKINDPGITKDALITMRTNALRLSKIELAECAKTILDRRFPGWDAKKIGSSGATPTAVRFRDQKETFPTAKAAYIWLVDKFVQDKPEVLEGSNWKSDFVSEGRGVRYFSRDLQSLFQNSPHLSKDQNNYSIVEGGWYVDLNLSNIQKYQILHKFSAAAEYEFEVDWYWEVLDGREEYAKNLFDNL